MGRAARYNSAFRRTFASALCSLYQTERRLGLQFLRRFSNRSSLLCSCLAVLNVCVSLELWRTSTLQSTGGSRSISSHLHLHTGCHDAHPAWFTLVHHFMFSLMRSSLPIAAAVRLSSGLALGLHLQCVCVCVCACVVFLHSSCTCTAERRLAFMTMPTLFRWPDEKLSCPVPCLPSGVSRWELFA